MGKVNIALRPIHYACVSGGKDSLFMLNLILHNLDKYPLEMVVHYQLEIDWDWAEKVVDYMESECNKYGIKFVRVKPRNTWEQLRDKYGMPTRVARWCNSKYKLDCAAQIKEWIKNQNCRPLAYIGFCADENKRFKYDIGNWEHQDVCYPLAEEGITEDVILEWARTVPIFNGWYKIFDRQGCMLCPMIKRIELAYMLKYYPESYDRYMNEVRRWERERKQTAEYWGDTDSVKMDSLIRTKWLKILDEKENYRQITIDEWLGKETEA